MSPNRIIRAAIALAPTIEGVARLADIRLHRGGYAEPEHDNPPSGIVAFGDWSEVEAVNEETGERQTIDYMPPKVSLMLNRIGVETQWAGDWAFCDRCKRAFRTHGGNNSFWHPAYFRTDSGLLVCRCCAQSDPGLFFAEADGRFDRMLTFELPLEQLGYVRLQNSLEFNPRTGTGHSPKVIASSLHQQGLRRFLFRLLYEAPDDLLYELWLHDGELDAMRKALVSKEAS